MGAAFLGLELRTGADSQSRLPSLLIQNVCVYSSLNMPVLRTPGNSSDRAQWAFVLGTLTRLLAVVQQLHQALVLKGSVYTLHPRLGVDQVIRGNVQLWRSLIKLAQSLPPA